METDVYASGWHALVDPQTKVSGVWTLVQEIYANHGGTWSTTWKRNFIFNDSPGSQNNYNLIAKASVAGWNGTDPLVATINIGGGVVIGSSSATAAFAVGSLPATSTVLINNSGLIVGHGGTGGTGGSGTTGFGGAGQNATAGQLAISIAYPTTIANSGIIAGGGGGGGGAATSNDGDNGGDGGGGGAGSGTGGSPGTGSIGNGISGDNGTSSAGGSGHHGAGFGDGGGLGIAGDTGNPDDAGGGSGGAAGDCTSGIGNITWSPQGDTRGALN